MRTKDLDEQRLINVLIVDDDFWTTLALQQQFDQDPGFEVTRVVHSGEEAIRAYDSEPVDIVLMDVRMGRGMTGIEATAAIIERHPDAKILTLTTVAPGPGLARAIMAGAMAAVHKTAPAEVLLSIVRTAVQGEDPVMLRSLGADVLVSADTQLKGAEVPPMLTRAEQRVLELVCDGLSYSEINLTLRISQNTLETHTRHLREKLGAKTLSQLVVKAVEFQLVCLG